MTNVTLSSVFVCAQLFEVKLRNFAPFLKYFLRRHHLTSYLSVAFWIERKKKNLHFLLRNDSFIYMSLLFYHFVTYRQEEQYFRMFFHHGCFASEI